MAYLPRLPPEIISKILSLSIETDRQCVFSLFVPDWNICPRKHRRLEASLRMTRFDTYMVLEGNQGHISTSFDHGEHDCIYLPILRDPRELPNIETHFDRELVKDWSGSSTMVFGQQQKAPNLQSGWASYLATRGGFPLREPRAMGRRAPKDYLPLIPKLTGLPQPRLYLYQRFRHLILNTDPSLAEALMTDAWVYPLTASLSSQVVPWLIAEQLDIERHANLSIDWRAMPSLESLFLDIRGFSQMVIDEDKVEDAAKMLEGKNLDLLVIAGLRSLEFYPGPEDMKVEEPRNGNPKPGRLEVICGAPLPALQDAEDEALGNRSLYVSL